MIGQPPDRGGLARQPDPGRPLLVQLSGLPGSGKSTFARRLARQAVITHLETDSIRRELFPVRTYSYREHQAVFQMFLARAREALEQGSNVLLDATHLSEGARRPAALLAEELGAGLAVVQFRPPSAEIERRLQLRAEGHDPHDLSEADQRVYRMLQRALTRPRANHWTVRTDADAGQVLAELLALLPWR